MLLPWVCLLLATKSFQILADDPSGVLRRNNIIYVTVFSRHDGVGESLVVLSFTSGKVRITTVNDLYGTLKMLARVTRMRSPWLP